MNDLKNGRKELNENQINGTNVTLAPEIILFSRMKCLWWYSPYRHIRMTFTPERDKKIPGGRWLETKDPRVPSDLSRRNTSLCKHIRLASWVLSGQIQFYTTWTIHKIHNTIPANVNSCNSYIHQFLTVLTLMLGWFREVLWGGGGGVQHVTFVKKVSKHYFSAFQ